MITSIEGPRLQLNRQSETLLCVRHTRRPAAPTVGNVARGL